MGIRWSMTTPSTRCARLRSAFGESQPQFAQRLRVSQQTISRMEKGQDEYGPVSLIFDLIEADLASGLDVTADGYVIGASRTPENRSSGFTTAEGPSC
jgi:transcriptional regulator with XRE-family HTH domain